MDVYREQPANNLLGIPLEFAFAIVALLVSVNIIYLDILVFGHSTKPQEPLSVVANQSTPIPLTANPECPQSCLSKIEALTTSPKNSGTPPVTAPSPTEAPGVGVKEYFIPFGAGFGSSTDWQDVAGLAASIDTTNYAKLKSVTFEATLRIPTGNQSVFVRLFNATDKHPVWFSDISLEGGVTKLIVSSPITLDPGNNVYQVQLKTSLGYISNIDQSRLRIVTQ